MGDEMEKGLADGLGRSKYHWQRRSDGQSKYKRVTQSLYTYKGSGQTVGGDGRYGKGGKMIYTFVHYLMR